MPIFMMPYLSEFIKLPDLLWKFLRLFFLRKCLLYSGLVGRQEGMRRGQMEMVLRILEARMADVDETYEVRTGIAA